jgi:hypothetical protein
MSRISRNNAMASSLPTCQLEIEPVEIRDRICILAAHVGFHHATASPTATFTFAATTFGIGSPSTSIASAR